MSKVVLLHHDWEWTEKQISRELQGQGIDFETRDIRTVELQELTGRQVVINRVYTSVANRDYPSVVKALALVEKLSLRGVSCISGPRACKADYDKYFACEVQKAAHVPIARCQLIDSENLETIDSGIKAFAKDVGYPVVLKPNTGGRGKDIHLLENCGQIENALARIRESRRNSDYRGGWIIQKFIRTTRPYDCRIAVCSGKVVHAYRRTLIPTNGSIPWMGSRSLGSSLEDHVLEKEEEHVAIQGTAAIEASFNMLDITFSERGPVVIENNVTPNYRVEAVEERTDIFLNELLQLVKRKLND